MPGISSNVIGKGGNVDLNNTFYILYIQNTSETRKTNRLVVFYSRETLDPVIAFDLTALNCIPTGHAMLEHVTITLTQYRQFKKKFTEMGILQDRGKALPEKIS